MESKSGAVDEAEIRSLLKSISEAWLNGNTGKLNHYFHDRMTIRGPDLQRLGAGKQECVKSYEDFTKQAVIREYEELEPEIELYGDTAVVVSPWKITCELKDQQYQETGRDLLVLNRDKQAWLVVWRASFPHPES